MATNTTYLITGVSRGIGHGLLTSYLARPNTTVIAGVREPRSSEKALAAIPVAKGSNLITVKIDSTSPTDPKAAVETLRSQHGITKIDVVIANAGIGNAWDKVLDTSAESLREHVEINAIAPLLLFQAVYPLLAAAAQPKFIIIGTNVSSLALTGNAPLASTAYGASKIAANYLMRKIHFEHPGFISFALHPGWVKTEMGNSLAESLGLTEAAITVDQSVEGVMQVVDTATRESTSGKLVDYQGKDIPW